MALPILAVWESISELTLRVPEIRFPIILSKLLISHLLG